MPGRPFLRRALLADAPVSGAAGLLMAVGAGPLQELLHVPKLLMLVAGVILIPYAFELALLARRSAPSASLVWAVIATNVTWPFGSVLLHISRIARPNPLGYAFRLVQGLAVAAFAEVQYVGLRKAAATA